MNLDKKTQGGITTKFPISLITVENLDHWKVKICTKVQSSKISEFLGLFQDQKMDIISCHDCQFSKCKNQIIRLAWFDFKYKKIHIQRIWDNENEFKKQC